jgi:hypothetical protein
MHPTRIFKEPEDLKKAWDEYKVERDAEAIKWAKVQYVGKDGSRVEDLPPMPYDLDGFYAWYLDKYGKHIHQYFERTNEYEEGFLGIVTHIRAERNNNIKTGTLLGFFNSSMGNRIVGLTEKTENKNENTNRNITIEVKETGVPLAENEKDIKLD